MSEYSQPLVSIDVVPVWTQQGRVFLGLGRRQFEPFAGRLALPGVLLGHERSWEAAHRALSTKVGVDAEAVLDLVDIGIFDAAERDPRGPTLSISKLAVIEPGAAGRAAAAGTLHAVLLESIATQQPDEEFALPFDHNAIARSAAGYLADRLFADAALTRALLGGEFSTKDAVAAARSLPHEGTVDPSNIRRRLTALPGLQALKTKVAEGRGHPSTAWKWGR